MTKTKYMVGIYVRLSREDGDELESYSIANQKQLCKDYLKSHPNLKLYDVYEDDGYSGVNFERPNFLRLMEDVRSNKVNCVIVKDLSRFARNWIEAGRYLQYIFPMLHIRFIAISENFDTETADEDTMSLFMPMRNLMNEGYAGDISVKTRSHFDTKRKNGEFVGAFVPYGYKRSEENKNKLIIDEPAAENVRKIFKLFLQGLSLSRISNQLNEYGVLSPMEYKISEGGRFKTSFKKNLRTKWTPVAVKRILSNEVYIGNLLQGKRGTVNYKDKNVRYRPESEWVRVNNTHEAIILQTDFEMAQKLLRYDTRISPNNDKLYVFSGILFCGDCKQNMVRKTVTSGDKKYFYYRCSTHKEDKNKCSQHSISEPLLFDTVLSVLKQHINNVAELEDILVFIDGLPHETQKYKKITNEIERLQQVIETKDGKKLGLYDDLKDGIISQDDFTKFFDSYSRDIEDLENAIGKYNSEIEALESNSHYAWMEEFKKHSNITELDREIVINLIDKIYVYEDKRIEIKYNYSDEYAAVYDYVSAFNTANEEAVI